MPNKMNNINKNFINKVLIKQMKIQNKNQMMTYLPNKIQIVIGIINNKFKIN